ncbi:uncharacterized protein LOC125039670 [Penaeus chinensis]|uniref:uncharacterized protein LOC125039670 n=1 Tax=Penaeus chinensis TaxID=139456 RepID=UPI001FB7EFD4|nr:uncharacterized protein LOC125039670 [Penaeus chinensis]
MSRIRPLKSSKSSSSSCQPVTLRGMASNGAGEGEAAGPSPSTATTAFTPGASASKCSAGAFEAEASGFGTVNPLFLDTDDECLPDNLPAPLRPTIPASQSMPSISQGLAASPLESSAECFAAAAAADSSPHSPVTPNLTPPPNTPLSPLSTPSSPKRRKSPTSGQTPDPNPLSPDLVPPPNTPLSPGSYPASPHQSLGLPINKDETGYLQNASPGSNGPLDNILSPDPVDLTNLRPLAGDAFAADCKMPRKLFLTDNMNKAEAVIKELVTLGNGVYDESSHDRNGNRPPAPKRFHEHLVKSGDWSALQDREKRIAACWNHTLHEEHKHSPSKNALPLSENRVQKSSNGPVTKGKHGAQKQSDKKRASKTSAANERKPLLLEQRRGWDFKQGTRYRKLKIPMIDDDDDNYRKPDSPRSSSSSSFSLDILTTDGAAQLAEQLCDVTSEAGRLITQEVREVCHFLYINYPFLPFFHFRIRLFMSSELGLILRASC